MCITSNKKYEIIRIVKMLCIRNKLFFMYVFAARRISLIAANGQSYKQHS